MTLSFDSKKRVVACLSMCFCLLTSVATLAWGASPVVHFISLQNNVADSLQTGDTVQFAATAVGDEGAPVYYRFDLIPGYGTAAYDPYDSYEVIQDFSTSGTVHHTFSEPGGYVLIARASEAAGFTDGPAPIMGKSVAVGDASSILIDSLGMNIDGAAKVGETVTFTVSAVNPLGGDIYYRFDLVPAYGTDGYDPYKNYTTIRDFATTATASHTFTEAGSYVVVAYASAIPGFQEGTTPIIGGSISVEDYATAATYPVVDTGQVLCYDDSGLITCPGAGEPFYGQDAQHTGNMPDYTDNGDGTVTDNVTGLMWQQSPDSNGDGTINVDDKMTYDAAAAGAASFALAGYTDWRLPTIKELYSLIDFNGLDPSGYNGSDTSGLVPFIDTGYFDFGYGDTGAGERIIDAQFASATLYVSTAMGGNETMFGVNLADGRIKGYPVTSPNGEKLFYVLYVRGNTAYGQNDFQNNGDGTVTDSATGLMWTQSDSGTGMNWEDALAWVAQKNAENYLGYNDWRLPNAKELQSIVDYTRSPDTTGSAAIDPVFSVTGITNEAGQADYPCFWSGTTHSNWSQDSGGYGAYVAFGRAMGYMNGSWMDVHGAGAQRSDPKFGDPADWPFGHGPQGDAIRIHNYIRLVRDAGNTASLESDAGDVATAYEGYNLFAPLSETTTYLMGNDGTMVHTWASDYRPGNSVYLLENGNLLRTGNVRNTTFDVGGAGGIVQEIAQDGTVAWEFAYSGEDYLQHHDIESLPNGNMLMIAWDRKTEAEALQAGRDPSSLTGGELWPDSVIEVRPSESGGGEIVWEWHAWNHFVQDYDAGKDNYGVVADHPELIDINYVTGRPNPDMHHINSVDYNAELDQIVLSVHNFSEIWIIDHSTTTAEAAGHSGGNSGKGGDLLYRWGNPAACGRGDAADQKLFVQHDAEWIADGLPGAGNILIFNNGGGRSGGDYSSVEEIAPPVTAEGAYPLTSGAAYGPSNASWTYIADNPTDFYATNISGAQRLPNGNTLVCSGPDGYFFEVTDAGEIVWEYRHGDAVFRVDRYAPDFSGLTGLSL